jgi:hypothetical protein
VYDFGGIKFTTKFLVVEYSVTVTRVCMSTNLTDVATEVYELDAIPLNRSGIADVSNNERGEDDKHTSCVELA